MDAITAAHASCEIIIISIQPLGQFGQEPEPSQATGMALVRCILRKFLGVVCRCFPPAVRYVQKMMATMFWDRKGNFVDRIHGTRDRNNVRGLLWNAE